MLLHFYPKSLSPFCDVFWLWIRLLMSRLPEVSGELPKALGGLVPSVFLLDSSRRKQGHHLRRKINKIKNFFFYNILCPSLLGQINSNGPRESRINPLRLHCNPFILLLSDSPKTRQSMLILARQVAQRQETPSHTSWSKRR